MSGKADNAGARAPSAQSRRHVGITQTVSAAAVVPHAVECRAGKKQLLEEGQSIGHDCFGPRLDPGRQTARMHDHRPGEKSGAPVTVEVSATRDRHPANSILPADDKPMFLMSCVDPVSGFDTAGQTMRPAKGER